MEKDTGKKNTYKLMKKQCDECKQEKKVLYSNTIRNNKGTKIVLPLEFHICKECTKKFDK